MRVRARASQQKKQARESAVSESITKRQPTRFLHFVPFELCSLFRSISSRPERYRTTETNNDCWACVAVLVAVLDGTWLVELAR